MDASDLPDEETLKSTIRAEGTERIECPVCGDDIPAFELETDHAHSRELLELVVELLAEETETGRPCRGYEKDSDGDHSGEETGNLRETIIRFDPEGVAQVSMPERLRAYEEGASDDEIASIPECRVFSVGDQEDYERISEATLGVANAFVGSSLHAGYELVACPDCEYEGSVDQAVFPGGRDHCSDAEDQEGEED